MPLHIAQLAIYECAHGLSVEAGPRIFLALSEFGGAYVAFGQISRMNRRARTDWPRGISSPVERIRARGGLASLNLAVGVQPSAAGMVPSGAEHSVRRSVVPCDLIAAPLGREVIYHEERVFGVRMKVPPGNSQWTTTRPEDFVGSWPHQNVAAAVLPAHS